MKTEISLPDELFKRAEATAQAMHVSRSELYTRALSRYLQTEDDSAITAQLDQVYAANPAMIEPDFRRAALKLLKESEW